MASEFHTKPQRNEKLLQTRPLSAQEISRLTEQGCTCSDWSCVEVAEGFGGDVRQDEKLAHANRRV
jgi:hypothetical protein